jgi:hypothetical protein
LFTPTLAQRRVLATTLQTSILPFPLFLTVNFQTFHSQLFFFLLAGIRKCLAMRQYRATIDAVFVLQSSMFEYWRQWEYFILFHFIYFHLIYFHFIYLFIFIKVLKLRRQKDNYKHFALISKKGSNQTPACERKKRKERNETKKSVRNVKRIARRRKKKR